MADCGPVSDSGTVTVAIPTYNGQDYLVEAMKSVLAQQGVAFRLVVCDDASSDRTVEIARQLANRRTTVIANDVRAGLTANWNRCVEHCDSEFLCLFHQDDLMVPGNLERKIALLREHPEVAFVFSASEIIDARDNPVPESLVNRDHISDENRVLNSTEALQILLVKNVVRASSVVIRKSCLDQVGLFNPSYGHVVDWEMWLRLAAKFSVGWLAVPLVRVRWHQQSETHRQREKDTDLAEYRRLLDTVIVPLAKNLPNRTAILRQAKLQLAHGYLNRSYLCLRVYRQPARARENLLRALRLTSAATRPILHDPRFLAMSIGLLAAPRTTGWFLDRFRPAPDATQV